MNVTALNVGEKYNVSREIAKPSQSTESTALFDTAQSFADTLRTSEDVSKQAMIGDADPHTLILSLAQTELAVQTAVSVRDKIVEAYKEVLRMPV